ncbi:MAG: hypothetical protein DRP09_21580, partial [Candidatus Thorarchaeota archaeon]
VIDTAVNDSIILLPVLEERFELISGVEVDPNFLVTVSDIDQSGLLSEWTGVIESVSTSYHEGQFSEDYGLYEPFDSQGSWIVDTEESSEGVYGRTDMKCRDGALSVTINANETAPEYVVMELNYLSVDTHDHPFLRWKFSGDGSLRVTLALNITQGSSTEVFNVSTYEATEEVVDSRNLLVELRDSSRENWTIQGVRLIIEEVSPGALDNKTVQFDELHIYSIRDWDLVVTVNTTVSSVAESDGLVLTLRSDKGKETRLRHHLDTVVDATMHRIFQWRERVGYSSQVNIRAVNTTSSSYSIDEDHANWAVITEDISDLLDVAEIELSVLGGAEEEGLAQFDWIRIVEPFASRFEWSTFSDGMWVPWGGLVMTMGLGFPPSNPQNEIDEVWEGSVSGQTVKRWSSYSGDPGSFSNGGSLSIHDAIGYDNSTWTFGQLTRDDGWNNLHSDGSQYVQDCGWGVGGKYSQSFYISSGQYTNSLQVYIKAEEQTGFYGNNIKWFIYSGTSSAPDTGSVLRSGSFDASTTSYQWRTISFSTLSSSGWYWISIQGNSYTEPQFGDPVDDTDAPGSTYYSKPYWYYASPSGSTGKRWWTTGTSDNDFITRVRFYATVTGSAIFNYNVRVNWHDDTGDHYTTLSSSGQTVSHAGADSVWVTADSEITNINPSNVQTYYRRPDASVSAHYQVDPDYTNNIW